PAWPRRSRGGAGGQTAGVCRAGHRGGHRGRPDESGTAGGCPQLRGRGRDPDRPGDRTSPVDHPQPGEGPGAAGRWDRGDRGGTDDDAATAGGGRVPGDETNPVGAPVPGAGSSTAPGPTSGPPP